MGVGQERREAAWGGMRVTPGRRGTSNDVSSLKSGSVPSELRRTGSARGRPGESRKEKAVLALEKLAVSAHC